MSHLKVHTYADSSPRKVSILLDLEHFVSFVGLGILCFCSDPNDPSADAMEKVVRWSSDLNHIMFIFQCGIWQQCDTTQSTEETDMEWG